MDAPGLNAQAYHKLTHPPLDKMATIFNCIFLNETFWILIKISLKFVLKGPIDYNPALV